MTDAKDRLGRIRCLAVLAAFFSLSYGCDNANHTLVPATSQNIDAPIANETYLWRSVAVGGGGFLTGYDVDATGTTRVVRADVYGAYIWSPGGDRWVQLVTAASMPLESQIQDGANEGVFEVVVAPSNPSRIYMALKGMLYRSDNNAQTFNRVSPNSPPFPLRFDANGEQRHAGPFIAVSPNDPDTVLFGSPLDGLWRSSNAGGQWTRIESVPSRRTPDVPSLQAGIVIWFIPGTDRVWAMVHGTGVLESNDSGRTFKLLVPQGVPQPRTLRQGVFFADGAFIGVDPIEKQVWRYGDGAWMKLVVPGAQLKPLPYASVAAEPGTRHAYLFDEGGNSFRSVDGGLNWTRLAHGARVGERDPPWLRVADKSYFAIGKVVFDPVVPGRLWAAAGTGIYYADVSIESGYVHWISQTRGIEELVANDIVQPTARAPLFAAWDFGIHVKEDLNAFSTTYGPKERVLIAAQQLDWSHSTPDFIVTNASDTRTLCCAEDGDAVLAGFSKDGGKTWAKFANLPTPPGTLPSDPWRMSFGSIAVSSGDTKNIIWAPTYNRSPFYTKDQGVSWKRVELEGEHLPFTGSHARLSYVRKTVVADRNLSGVFYLVHSGDADNFNLTGLWRTTDGGVHWERVYEGEIAPDSSHSAKLRSVPGYAGHLFFTSGVAQGDDLALRRSTDGGRSWSSIEAVQRVDDIAFGKPAKNVNYPTIFLSGRVRGVYGIWRSTDIGRSWTQVAHFPIGVLDQVSVIGADPTEFGRVYVGYKGSGWRYGEPATCAPKPYKFADVSECFELLSEAR